MKKAKCKFCGKPIFWVVMRETGKNMPLDATARSGIQVNLETMTGFRTRMYIPHFPKCTPAGRKGLEEEYNS